MACNSRGWSSNEKISCVKTFRGELGLRDQTRRAGALHFLGVAQLMAVGGGAERDEDGGTAAAATSATVIAPARQTIKSACANRSAMFPMKGSTSPWISRRA